MIYQIYKIRKKISEYKTFIPNQESKFNKEIQTYWKSIKSQKEVLDKKQENLLSKNREIKTLEDIIKYKEYAISMLELKLCQMHHILPKT